VPVGPSEASYAGFLLAQSGADGNGATRSPIGGLSQLHPLCRRVFSTTKFREEPGFWRPPHSLTSAGISINHFDDFWFSHRGLEPHLDCAHAGHTQVIDCNGGQRLQFASLWTPFRRRSTLQTFGQIYPLLTAFTAMTQSFSIKRPGAWLWKTNLRFEQIFKMLKDGLITYDWLICPLGEANKAESISKFINKISQDQRVHSITAAVQPVAHVNVTTSCTKPVLFDSLKRRDPRIFISYRRNDSAAMTGRIYDRLETHYGRRNVFIDLDSIPIGTDFREHIETTLEGASVLLAIIGDIWLNDSDESGRRLDNPRDLVRIEIGAALQMKIPVVPVLVGKAGVPKEDELPASLSSLAYRNAIRIDSALDFRNHVDRLISGLERLLHPEITSE
jgi:hypothetical protein